MTTATQLDDILERLRAAGGRITSARRALVTALLEYDGHPTAEGLAAAALVLALAIPAVRASHARAAGPVFTDAAGIHVVSQSAVDSRQYDVQVSSAALGRAVDIRVLLPTDYDTNTGSFPVLYLFHGTSGRASDWVNFGDAEAATASLELVTVMPDAG